jgi:RNA 2',3'-cyclic 3'-phosphodiesterase
MLQLCLPGFERGSETDSLFFALRFDAENAAAIVLLRERLCLENGLRGRRIAADLLHVTLHGVGAYDGLPNIVIEKACEAGEAISTATFALTFDRAMSFKNNGGKRPLVLLPSRDLAGLFSLHFVLGEAIKRAGIMRQVRSHFTPHMTLLYARQQVQERPVEPIRMDVRDFALVHSIVGHSRHIELARWSLRG